MTGVMAPETPGTAVAVPAPRSAMRMLRPVAAPAELLAQQNETREFIQKALQEGRDYGKIPGIDKPTLLKPGAEKVILAFGCSASSRIVEQEVDHDREVKWIKRKSVWSGSGSARTRTEEVTEGVSLGLYRYVIETTIVDQDGVVRGTGLGSCSTMESKYIDRPRDCENTVVKMATKRSMIAAALATFGLSEQFTQDVEDMPHAAGGSAGADVGAGDRDPRDTVMRFGFAGVKGKRLGELADDALRNAIDWATKNDKFPEIVADCRAVLKLREEESRPPKAVPEIETTAAIEAEIKKLPADLQERTRTKWLKQLVAGCTEEQAQDVLSKLLTAAEQSATGAPPASSESKRVPSPHAAEASTRGGHPHDDLPF